VKASGLKRMGEFQVYTQIRAHYSVLREQPGETVRHTELRLLAGL